MLFNKRTHFAQTKAEYQSGCSQEITGSVDGSSWDSSASSSIGSTEADKGGDIPSSNLFKCPSRSTPNSSARSFKSGSDRVLSQIRRPTQERKLSTSRCRLAASDRQLSTAAEDTQSVTITDSREACIKRQLTKSRRNLLTRGVVSARCLRHPVQDINNGQPSRRSSSSRSLANFVSDYETIVAGAD